MTMTTTTATTESPLARICREAVEHNEYVVAHPAEFDRAEVERAQLFMFQHVRLQPADILRYE